jgi:hypothetical protein
VFAEPFPAKGKRNSEREGLSIGKVNYSWSGKVGISESGFLHTESGKENQN